MHSDVFLNIDGSIWGIALCLSIVFGIFNLLFLAFVRAWHASKKRVALTLAITAVIATSITVSFQMTARDSDDFAQRSTASMKSSVADSYELKLLDAPHFNDKSDRTQLMRSSFQSPEGKTVERMLAFERPDGRAVVIEMAAGQDSAR